MTEWRSIAGCPGYEVSDDGRVRSWAWGRPHVLKLRYGGRDRYPIVAMQIDKRPVGYAMHRLVAAAFLGPRPAGMEIRHLNGDPRDNRLQNLAYGSHSENMLDKVRHGTHHEVRKSHCPAGHEYDGVRANGKRFCYTCQRESAARSRERRRADPAVREEMRAYFARRYRQQKAAGLR